MRARRASSSIPFRAGLGCGVVGLLVAIPAVLAFNYFNRRVRASVANADAAAHALLAEMRGEDVEDAGAKQSPKSASEAA